MGIRDVPGLRVMPWFPDAFHCVLSGWCPRFWTKWKTMRRPLLLPCRHLLPV